MGGVVGNLRHSMNRSGRWALEKCGSEMQEPASN